MRNIFYIILLFSSLAFGNDNIDEQKKLNSAAQEIDKGNLERAITILKGVLKTNSKQDEARFQLASVYHFSKKNKLALVELGKIKNNPETIKIVPILKGNILIEEKKWKDALALWQNFSQDNADLKSLRFEGLAKSYEGLGNASAAASSWTEFLLLQVKPTNDIFERIAKNRIKSGEKEKALNACTTLSILQSHKAYQEICKAHVYRADGNIKLAIEAIQAALLLDKENIDAKTFLISIEKK